MDRELSPLVEAFALPSRRAALDACRRALAEGIGPVLLTGEAGVGKTWLSRRLAAEAPGLSGWVGVDLSPTTRPADLIRMIGRALGMAEPRTPGAWRIALAEGLAEEDADGRRWGLIVDEAHLAGAEILEELRVLSNRLGEADGFRAMVLIGQTSLACRFETRPLAALEVRLAARIHLRSIDADEARDLLDRLRPGSAGDLERVERWHRDSGGNPRRLLRLAAHAQPISARTLPATPAVTPGPAASAPANPPRLGEARPPIRLEEGLIEVGWDAEPEPRPAPAVSPAAPAEESVHDHYAALQAWDEWTGNQERAEADPAVVTSPAVADAPEEVATPLAGHPQVWAEGQQAFAPYSQLFSRLKQPRDQG